MNYSSDEYLMEQIKLGNIEYMTEVFNRYNHQILNYFFRLSGNVDDSEDLTQTVFLRLLKYRKSYNQSKSFKSWIYRIAKNTLNNHFNSKVLKTEYTEIHDLQAEPNPTIDENSIKLYRSINLLSAEYKELIILSKFQGLKYREIAEMFSTTEASIKNKIFRALDKLRSIYFDNE